MAKVRLGARIEKDLSERIDGLVARDGGTKTDVVERALGVGLDQLEREHLEAGFALLADPAMQDMTFPTGAQIEAMHRAD